MWWRTSNCSPLLIYRPREDERLSWPGCLTYSDGLPTKVVTHQLQVERRTAKERWPETDVLPLSHADQRSISKLLVESTHLAYDHVYTVLGLSVLDCCKLSCTKAQCNLVAAASRAGHWSVPDSVTDWTYVFINIYQCSELENVLSSVVAVVFRNVGVLWQNR